MLHYPPFDGGFIQPQKTQRDYSKVKHFMSTYYCLDVNANNSMQRGTSTRSSSATEVS